MGRMVRGHGRYLIIQHLGVDPVTVDRKERARLLYHAKRIAAERRAAQRAASKALHSRRLREAMPDWVDRHAVLAFYIEARRLTRETGIPHEVDHIEPLVRPDACGLHVEWNLRVIPRAVNRRKGNRRESAAAPHLLPPVKGGVV